MKNFLKNAGLFGLCALLVTSSAFVGVSIYDLKRTIEYRKLTKLTKELQRTIESVEEKTKKDEN